MHIGSSLSPPAPYFQVRFPGIRPGSPGLHRHEVAWHRQHQHCHQHCHLRCHLKCHQHCPQHSHQHCHQHSHQQCHQHCHQHCHRHCHQHCHRRHHFPCHHDHHDPRFALLEAKTAILAVWRHYSFLPGTSTLEPLQLDPESQLGWVKGGLWARAVIRDQ